MCEFCSGERERKREKETNRQGGIVIVWVYV
jgi:hypothetical protein